MDWKSLDLLFPKIVLFYGFFVTWVLHSPRLWQGAEQRLPGTLLHQLKLHRGLALVCLVVGGLWTLQLIWLQ